MRFLIARLFSVTTAAAAYLTEDQRPKILLILFYYRVHIVNFTIKQKLKKTVCYARLTNDFRLERNDVQKSIRYKKYRFTSYMTPF